MTSDNQNNELSCQLCKTSHTSEWELKEHLWSLLHHVKLKQKEKNTSHQCVLCQTSTENLVDYGRHLNDQKHKQALEKAKEKKKAKPKLPSSSRHALQKIGKQKPKKALLPNPHWHLNSSYNPMFQFGNWKPRDDFHWKKHSNHPEMQGLNPQPFNNNQYWNNNNCNDNNNVFRFNANNKNPYERWNKPSHMMNGSVVELNQPNPNNIGQNTMGRKFIVSPNNQKLKKGLPPNKAPLGTKNSKSSTDSNGHSESQKIPLETSSKAADNSKGAIANPNSTRITKKLSQTGPAPTKPQVTASPQVSKIKTNISKLKAKGGVVKPAINKKKEKQPQKPLCIIDKDCAGNVIDKGNGEMLEDNQSRKKFIVATLAKKRDNIPAATVNTKNPSPKKRPQVVLKNGKPTEKQQISAENTNKPCGSISPAKKNSSVNPSESNAKVSGDTNTKEDVPASLKRSLNSADTPNSASSSNPSKKRRSDPPEPRLTIEADSPNPSTVANPGSKQKTSPKANSSKPNDSIEKDKSPSVSSDLTPTKEPTASPKILPSTQNENGFKVNKELVTKLHKNLVGQSPMKLPNSSVKSKTSSHETVTHSKDEASPAGKQSPVNVRREELVKMMKLPRLSRKEKMHLSSLLQSYTKSQNKKLAVPRLTMQLSGLYDSSSQDTADAAEMSELELPDGMEEEIAHLIKREKLEELSGDGIIDNRNLGLPTQLRNVGLQRAKKKNVPNSVGKKKPIRNQTVSENPQAGQSSPQGVSNVKIERSDDQRLSDVVSPPAVCREPVNTSRRESNMQLETNPSFSTPSSDPPETSSQTNSSAPVTTGTQSNSSENMPASSQTNSSDPVTTGTQFSENIPALSQSNSSDPGTTGTTATQSDSANDNTENVFTKVYLLTLREEQIRSSIVDMNEKMNYLRKLIEDSQMALQGCCIEHKRLLEEESTIRDQRLKILQDAMTGKSGSTDSINPSHLQQNPSSQSLQAPGPQSLQTPATQSLQNPALQSLQSPIPNPQPEQTFSQTDFGHDQSSVIGHLLQQQPSVTATQNQFSNQPIQPNFPRVSGMISSANGRGNQTQESLPPSRSLDIPSKLSPSHPQVQSSVPPDPLPNEHYSPIDGNNPSGQNQSSPLNLVDTTISVGSDATSTNNGFSENGNTAANIVGNVTPREGSPLGFEHVTIKQEPPSPPPPPQANIETNLCPSQDLVNNNPCNNSAPPTTTFLEGERLPEGRQTESAPLDNITDALSGDARKQGLPSAATIENETMTFETVQIKKEPLTPPPPPQTETEEQFDSGKEQEVESQLRIESTCTLQIGSLKEKSRNSSDKKTDDVTPDETLEQSSHNELTDSAAEPSPVSTPSKTPEAQSVINFESVEIKKEPLTPPPHPQAEETFFVPRLPSSDSNEETPAPVAQNENESQMEIEKNTENMCSPPSERNLSGSGGQTETPGKSSGMSMTYLGKMPNNFLEKLALSWRKQNMSATTNECSSLVNEHSFSDSESTSSRTVCSFISKTSPKFSVPARLNPRVCLEPLNMKFHRKRTLSEPVSSCDSGSLSTGDMQQEGSQGKDETGKKSSSLKTLSEKERPNCDNIQEGPKAKRKSLRRGSRSRERRSGLKENKSESQADPPVRENEASSSSDVTDPFLNNEENIVVLDLSDVDNLKESKLCSRFSEDSAVMGVSDIKQNNPVGSLNELSVSSPNVAQTEINFDPKSPTNALNIWNNLSSLHVVRTKKFPRTHVNGSQLPTFRGAKNPVNGLYVFENHLYASYQGNSPCKFSLGSGECLQVYNCKPYNVQCMLVCRISANKTRLFSGGASEVLLVFDEVTGKICSQIDTCLKIYSLHENWGSLFVGLANGGVTKINLKSLKKTSELSYGSKPINCLATCTEGAQKLLCVGAYDASILIVDAMTGLLLKTLNCYHRLLYSIKVLHNLIFSCSTDKTLQVHDVTSGKLLRCLQDHTSTISCLHVEDNLLVTGSHDKRLNIYNSSHPREAPIIFYTTSKESISCLAVHNKVVYCGNFFGHIETIQFETGQKWICKYDCCELVFGQRQGLFYHLVKQHLQMTGMDKKKCLWENCGEYIYSVLDITEHCENHINQIVQPE